MLGAFSEFCARTIVDVGANVDDTIAATMQTYTN